MTGRLVAAADFAYLGPQSGQLLLAGGEVGTTVAQFTLDHPAFTVESTQLDLEPLHQAAEVNTELVDHLRLGDLDDHQQQDDGAEATGDHIEERQVEDFDLTSLAPSHGQSLAGVMNEPPVAAASCQKAAAA